MNKKLEKQNNNLLKNDLNSVSGGFRYIPKPSSDFKTNEEYEQYKQKMTTMSQEFDPRYKKR